VLHLIVLIILAFWYLEPPVKIPDVVEVTFVTLTPPASPPPTLTKTAPGRTGAAVKAQKGKALPSTTSRRVKLPERSSVTRDQVLAVPKAKKLDVPESSGGSKRVASKAGSATKDGKGGSAAGTRTGQLSPGKAAGTGTGTGKGGPGIADRDAGSTALGSIQWIGGGRRRKISGSLPGYPSGTNVEAQIRLEAAVTAGGTVKSVRPTQKGNARLEEAAMRALRQWRFEPLSRNLPQKDQRCIITFNFTLR
jgi:TonB family protein